MSTFPNVPLVWVEWVDSTGCNSWQKLDGRASAVSACRSVGWMLEKTADHVTLYSDLATHPANEHAHGHSEQVIPRGCVKRIVVLKDPSNKRQRRVR